MENRSTLPDVQSMMFNPWLEIWFRPRGTIRRILDTDPKRHVLLLAALGGVVNILSTASNRSWGNQLALPVILALSLTLGPIAGVIGLYIGGAFGRLFGSWFGGQATSEHVRAAIAWSQVPSVFSLALWVPAVVIFRQELFTDQTARIDSSLILAFGLLGFGVALIVLGIWEFFIYVKCFSEAHRFSAWRGLAALIVPPLAIVLPLCICIVLLTLASR